ncbi:MAG: GntR family transcriptional regulator [Gammaproteobacteria bacterium]|jgi:GntR family transcriptional regulator|nr:GntR family transcriptional regulator [Gammaproteobacteria bacterium]
MESGWNDKQPIYLQIRDRIVALILEGRLAEGEAVPSVRSFAGEFKINPITVSKGYQQLSEEGLVEKRRGLGMFVADGARQRLRDSEREQFLNEEWPEIQTRIQRLGLKARDLLGQDD